MPRTNAIFAKARLYDDGSGIETGVQYDPTFVIEGNQYVHIKGIGEPATVRLDHIDLVIGWLQNVQAAALIHEEQQADAIRRGVRQSCTVED